MPRISSFTSVIKVDAESWPDVSPFIDAASSLVDAAVAYAADKGITYTSQTAAQIELWLSAHIYASCPDPRNIEEEVDELTERKAFKISTGFDNTHYGQMAKQLDTAGYLAYLDAQSKMKPLDASQIKKVRFLYVGEESI